MDTYFREKRLGGFEDTHILIYKGHLWALQDLEKKLGQVQMILKSYGTPEGPNDGERAILK